eukprot:SAG25_NODE_302_length_10160_cov_3.981413_6_plen_627_part_00
MTCRRAITVMPSLLTQLKHVRGRWAGAEALRLSKERAADAMRKQGLEARRTAGQRRAQSLSGRIRADEGRRVSCRVAAASPTRRQGCESNHKGKGGSRTAATRSPLGGDVRSPAGSGVQRVVSPPALPPAPPPSVQNMSWKKAQWAAFEAREQELTEQYNVARAQADAVVARAMALRGGRMPEEGRLRGSQPGAVKLSPGEVEEGSPTVDSGSLRGGHSPPGRGPVTGGAGLPMVSASGLTIAPSLSAGRLLLHGGSSQPDTIGESAGGGSSSRRLPESPGGLSPQQRVVNGGSASRLLARLAQQCSEAELALLVVQPPMSPPPPLAISENAALPPAVTVEEQRSTTAGQTGHTPEPEAELFHAGYEGNSMRGSLLHEAALQRSRCAQATEAAIRAGLQAILSVTRHEMQPRSSQRPGTQRQTTPVEVASHVSPADVAQAPTASMEPKIPPTAELGAILSQSQSESPQQPQSQQPGHGHESDGSGQDGLLPAPQELVSRRRSKSPFQWRATSSVDPEDAAHDRRRAGQQASTMIWHEGREHDHLVQAQVRAATALAGLRVTAPEPELAPQPELEPEPESEPGLGFQEGWVSPRRGALEGMHRQLAASVTKMSASARPRRVLSVRCA